MEQAFYQDKGFNPPKRCPQCRKNKSKLTETEHKNMHPNKKKHMRVEYDE